MSSQRVLVTYATALSFQASDTWKQFFTALRSQLPLRTIHWKSASRPNLRTIQELDISLVALDSIRDEHTSQIPVTLLEKPLLNIYVVSCEDAETYKTIVKKQLKDWQSSVTQRKNQEWLIIHVVHPDTKNVDRKFFNMKGSVLDKIRADFNVDKRDRCVQLAWSVGEQSPAVWAALIGKIKDGLLSALDIAVSSREEEVRRSESQRHMPGWNFCTYFVLKESLATSFEGVNLVEDALQQYIELEAAFMSVLRERNMSWFGSLINPTPKDDSSPLLSTSKKPYRDLILANTISVFDLRIYLLARQSALLNRMRQPIEICQKAMLFLSAFGKRLREVESALPEYFVESWIFSSALSVVDQCNTWATSWPEMEDTTLARYNASQGELLELAKSQLDVLGIKVGHLPSCPPFSMATYTVAVAPSSPLPEKRSSSHRISKYEIMLAIGDGEAFYDLYCNISNRAIDMYVKAGRRKFALKLHTCLAALDNHRGRLSNALTIFSSLPAHYAPHMWTSLESLMLSRAIDTHAVLKKPHDREWIHILLAFFKTYVNETTLESLVPHDIDEYVARLVIALREAAENLDSDLSHPDHPAMSFRITDDAHCSADEDLVDLVVLVHNHLPCDVDVDEISATLMGKDTSRLKFVAKGKKLVSGQNLLILSCATSTHGTYVLEGTEIQISHLRFHWNHKDVAGGRTSCKRSGLVHVPRNPEALDVQLCLPQKTALGASSQIQLVVFSGRNDILTANIRLSVPAGIIFDFITATLHPKGACEISSSTDCIDISGLSRGSNAIVLLPHSDASRFRAIKIDASITYKTAQHPNVTRTFRTSRTVIVALPIAVNVEDFFRGQMLFSRFTISTTTHQHVRLSSAKLLGPPDIQRGVKIRGCRPSHSVMTAVPDHPVNYIFCVESANGPVLDPLQLVIFYRLLREEVEALVSETVQDILSQRSQGDEQGNELIKKVVEYLESEPSWIELYSATGELLIPSSLDVGEGLTETFASVQKRLSQPNSPSSVGMWREMTIPVDVPRMNVIANAWIALEPAPVPEGHQQSPIYAGQPLSATLWITVSLHWSDPDNKQQQYRTRYDVEERTKDWLICGRKRGDFVVQDGTTLNVPLTLIALHHGELALPKVNVKPLPIVEDESMPTVLPSGDTHQSRGAATVLVLPRGGRSTFIFEMGADKA